ncbi:MAG: ORF6N domain-containing protein [Sedimentisphaerales bacterium]|nr:ORF6N domain-containing protein [Sedimentisphaerales bacterium]
MSKSTSLTIPIERIQRCIYLVREHKIILDSDLAQLYGVETGALVRAVKRNIERFPSDFMFQLSKAEYDTFLRCQFGISKKGRGGRRYMPYAFTEQGVAMLSSVLRSKRAIEVNIAIMRTFVKLREILAGNAALRRRIEAMERQYDEQFKLIFKVLSEMVMPTQKSKSQIGYLTEAEGHKKPKSKSK